MFVWFVHCIFLRPSTSVNLFFIEGLKRTTCVWSGPPWSDYVVHQLLARQKAPYSAWDSYSYFIWRGPGALTIGAGTRCKKMLMQGFFAVPDWTVHAREYWMIYRVPGHLAVVPYDLAPPQPPLTHHDNKLGRWQTKIVIKPLISWSCLL